MFFDTLIAGNGTVLFNGSPQKMKDFINKHRPVLKDDCMVLKCSTLKVLSMRDYLFE